MSAPSPPDTGRRALLRAVVDRIVPADDWPSASQAGVVAYLDRHAGGAHARLWADTLEAGLAALDAEARQRHGSAFAALDDGDADRLLADVEAGTVTGWPGSSPAFFDALVRVVAEGYYADQGNGGNLGARSWEMVGFRARPGAASETSSRLEAEPVRHRLGEVADRYDVVVVGAGAGGATAAAVLAEAGLRTLLVEREDWRSYDQIAGDHLRNHRLSLYGINTGPAAEGNPRTFVDPDGRERPTRPHDPDYHNNAMTVGGGSRVFGAQAWRFHPDDFAMATRYGVPEGSSLADWPITYDELAPFYDRIEWEMGVSGLAGSHPGTGPSGPGYPMPAFPPSTETRLLMGAAESLGWAVGPVPLLVNTVERGGRPACERCGCCVGFACPVDAKNGSHNTMLPRALASGHCDLVTRATVARLETDRHGRVVAAHVVEHRDGATTRRTVSAGHVVVAAGAIESARLLLNSASDREPAGLGNGSDQVGRHLQGHVYVGAHGLFDEPVADGLGPGPGVSTRQFSHGNPGVIGGGMLANEFIRLPISYWYNARWPGAPSWGLAGKQAMRHGYRRTGQVMGPTEEIPTPEARVRLSPSRRDHLGIPVAMLSGSLHPETLRTAEYLRQQATTWIEAAGPTRVWSTAPTARLTGGQHQAGTLRMGDDPSTSVTDPTGRVHGHDNLWVADGSVHVTNGGVNPVLTILALAYRTATHLAASA